MVSKEQDVEKLERVQKGATKLILELSNKPRTIKNFTFTNTEAQTISRGI